MYQAFLFDNDGTIADTHDLLMKCFRYATRHVLGYCIPDEQLRAKIGQPLDIQMWDFAQSQEQHDELVEVYRAYNHTIHDECIALFPGEKEALERICATGKTLGVVTSKLGHIAQGGLEVLGIADYFTCVIGAQETKHHKPSPEPLLFACDRLGLSAQQCVYIGDSPFDIQAAHAAHMCAVAVTWGSFSKSQLSEQHPDYICEDFGELARLLCSM